MRTAPPPQSYCSGYGMAPQDTPPIKTKLGDGLTRLLFHPPATDLTFSPKELGYLAEKRDFHFPSRAGYILHAQFLGMDRPGLTAFAGGPGSGADKAGRPSRDLRGSLGGQIKLEKETLDQLLAALIGFHQIFATRERGLITYRTR